LNNNEDEGFSYAVAPPTDVALECAIEFVPVVFIPRTT
jgi:hypothetical protein